MDWFSWLSKSHIQPPFIHEYALVFSHNQLQEDDIPYFNHEFLQSMGISIAKHRLEILKLARKSSGSRPMAKLFAAIKNTKRVLVRYVRRWMNRKDSTMVRLKRRSYSSRWKVAMLKRSNRLVMNKLRPATLLIANGYRPVVGSGGAKVNSFDQTQGESKEDVGEYGENLYSDDEDSGYWFGRSVKWDAMFQDLKPT